jgi:hypothetical protein
MGKTHFYLIGLIFFSAFLCGLCLHEGHVWGDDFALYIAQSKSIIEGTTADLLQKNVYLTDNSEIIEGGPIGPYLYPIGFPVLLSGIYAACGLDFMAMKILCGLFFVAALPVVYALFSTRFADKKYSLFLTAYVGFNFALISFTDNILSDFPFFFFSILIFYLIEKNRLNIGYQLFLSAMIVALYLIRDAGIVFIPVLVSQLFFKANQSQENISNYLKKSYLYILPILIFITFFVIKSVFFKINSTNLIAALSSINLKTLILNTAYYIFVLCELFISNSNYLLRLIVLLLLGCCFLNGIHKSSKADRHFIVFIILTMGIYIIFPGRQGLRYLFPIVPFLFYFSINGLLNAPFSLIKQRKNAILILLVIYIGGNGLVKSLIFRQTATNQITTPEALDMYGWVKKNTQLEDIIAFKKPRLLRLMTQRNGFSNSDDRKVTATTAVYLIENDKPIRSDSSFTMLYQNKNFIVYKIKHLN